MRRKGYFVDDNYLKNIDTEDKAYFLGWMLSDGTISKTSLSLKLKSSDEYIIKEVFNKFSNGYKISTDKTSKCIKITSKTLIEDLNKLGCIENKTMLGFNLPNLPNDLFRHFIRGYFDGDGSISKRSARIYQIQISICSIDNLFLQQLKNKLIENNIHSEIYKEIRNGKSLKRPNGEYNIDNIDMYRLLLTSHKEKLKFYEFLYNDCNTKLLRKFNLYNNYYHNTISLIIKKNSNIIKYINDVPIINYDLITENTFRLGVEVNSKLILNLYKHGRNVYSIHKELNISRSVINRIIKENNL